MYDDLIEFTGPDSAKYQEHFLGILANSLQDPDNDVRQAACYGCGVAALHGGPAYLQFCTQSLPHLFSIINSPDSRSEENIYVTENAISAVGKICRTFKDSGAFDSAQVLSMWIQTLPILEDESEATHVYSFLCELISAGHPSVVNQNEQHLMNLVNIITQVLQRPVLLETNQELSTQLVSQFRQILSGCDATMRNNIWRSIGPETQGFLQAKGFV